VVKLKSTNWSERSGKRSAAARPAEESGDELDRQAKPLTGAGKKR
jgi:hypothetical protein